MKTKQIKKLDERLRDVWDAHSFSRRDLKDKMQQSRLKMLMGAGGLPTKSVSDSISNWW